MYLGHFTTQRYDFEMCLGYFEVCLGLKPKQIRQVTYQDNNATH